MSTLCKVNIKSVYGHWRIVFLSVINLLRVLFTLLSVVLKGRTWYISLLFMSYVLLPFSVSLHDWLMPLSAWLFLGVADCFPCLLQP